MCFGQMKLRLSFLAGKTWDGFEVTIINICRKALHAFSYVWWEVNDAVSPPKALTLLECMTSWKYLNHITSKMCLTTWKGHYGQINTEMVQQTESLPSFIVGHFPPFLLHQLNEFSQIFNLLKMVRLWFC